MLISTSNVMKKYIKDIISDGIIKQIGGSLILHIEHHKLNQYKNIDMIYIKSNNVILIYRDNILVGRLL